MSYSIEFTLNTAPAGMNQIMRTSTMANWRAMKKLKNMVRLAVIAHGLPPEPLTKAKITLTRYAPRMFDYDGLVASFKPIVDGLCPIKGSGNRKNVILWPGVLAHDGWGVTGQWTVLQEKVPKGKEHIRVKVEAA